MATPDNAGLSSELLSAASTGPKEVITTLAAHLNGYVMLATDGLALHAGEIPSGLHGPQPNLYDLSGEGWNLHLEVSAAVDDAMRDAIALAVTSALAVLQRETLDREKREGELVLRMLHEPEHAPSIISEEPRPYVVLVARPDTPGQMSDSARWSQILRARDPRALIGSYSDEFVAVLSDDPALQDPEFISELLGTSGHSWGISEPGSAWEDLRSRYDSATSALTVSRLVYGPESVGKLHQLGAYRLLAQIPDADILRTYVTDTLGELGVRTDPEAADLRRTLHILLDTNLNIAESARRLHFHYNTVRYRLTKLEQMLGGFSTDPELRLSLALALRVLQIRGV